VALAEMDKDDGEKLPSKARCHAELDGRIVVRSSADPRDASGITKRSRAGLI